jgi:hypothetical protein
MRAPRPKSASQPDAEEGAAAISLREAWLGYQSIGPFVADGVNRPGRLTLLTSVEHAVGSRIAGGATLVVVADSKAARQLMRDGACDFVVSSLDEALRILKQEVRMGTSLSVALESEPALVLAECEQRGVQPDQLGSPHAALLHRGARLIEWETALQPGMHWITLVQPEGEIASLQQARMWMREALSAADSADSSDVRRIWLANAPAVLGRRFQRYAACPMNSAEVQTLLVALQQDKSYMSQCLFLMQDGAFIWP